MIRCEALESVGKIVEITTEYDGNYIGEILKVSIGSCNNATVTILACTEYPSQRSICYKENIHERKPLEYCSEHTFNVDRLKLFEGVIPEYYELMRKVIDTTFLLETEADRKIYERHLKHWEGKSHNDFLIKIGG
jgi:hypothetical protein